MPPLLLGIDIGSSAVKAAVFHLGGDQLFATRVPCPSAGDFPPERWWEATIEAVRPLPLAEIVAAAICGRGGTNVFLDSSGSVCAPSWDDARAAPGVRAARDEFANTLSPQSLALLGKARWWHERHGPVTTAFAAKDFIAHRLTGQFTTDPASGGTLGRPIPPLLAASDPWSLAGIVTSQAAGLCGLPADIPVAVGWHDGAAATFGAGAAAAGVAPVTLGTNAVYRVVTTRIPPSLHKYWDLTPGLTVTGGDILNAGLAYAWARSLLGDPDPVSSAAGASGVLFLPQLSGRIAPDRNLAARAGWHGLQPSSTPADLLRAVLEGTAFSLRQVRDWLATHVLDATRTVATGGGAHNPIQAQVLADVLQQPVDVANCEEGCRGAALLGAVAAGIVSLEHARLATPAYTRYAPQPTSAAVYDEAYQRFLALQRATDGI